MRGRRYLTAAEVGCKVVILGIGHWHANIMGFGWAITRLDDVEVTGDAMDMCRLVNSEPASLCYRPFSLTDRPAGLNAAFRTQRGPR